jgi:hypothetical protein
MNGSTSGPYSYNLRKFLKTKLILLHPARRCILELMRNEKMKRKSSHFAILPASSQQNKQTSDYYICLPYEGRRHIFLQIKNFVLKRGMYKQFSVS